MKRGTQTAIASKANISNGYLSQILSGKRRPSWKIAKILSAETNTNPELWLDASPEKIREVLGAVNF